MPAGCPEAAPPPPRAARSSTAAQLLREAQALLNQRIHLALPEVASALGPVGLRAPQEGEDGDQVVVELCRVDGGRGLEVELANPVRGE
eukprot:10810104-Alexandrium_andersonii.AAC.1